MRKKFKYIFFFYLIINIFSISAGSETFFGENMKAQQDRLNKALQGEGGGLVAAAYFGGAILDPLTWLIPVTRAKTLYQMAKTGFIAGGLAGAFGYVDDQSPFDTRLKQAGAGAIGGAIFFSLWVFFFRGPLFQDNRIRNLEIFHAFRLAKLRHYGAFFLLRSPLLIAAVFVYSAALGFFGVEVSSMTLLPLLPVIFFAATVPTPMRAAAITSWVILFPENEGQMAAFGFLQHNFFILFNAIIGLMFLPRANKELFGDKSA